MTFDYEQSIWGRGTATMNPSDPTSIRLRAALESLKNVPAGKKILELGCGAGQFIRAIKKQRPELECHGSDISKQALMVARETKDGVLYDEQGEKALPYEDGSFAAVLIFDVLEHVQDPAALIEEARRILYPGGIMYAFVPCEGDRLSLWRWLRSIGVGSDLTRLHAGHINYFSRTSLAELFIAHGFQLSALSYSEHIFGQLLGVAAFTAMGRAAKKNGGAQLNNESFFENKKQNSTFSVIKKVVNSLIFGESVLLRHVPSPNMHIVAVKK